MTIDSAVTGLSRASLIEAIYRASKIVSRTAYDFDSPSTRVRYWRPQERERLTVAVDDILTEIERVSKLKVQDLPVDKRAEVLQSLYSYLSEHISGPGQAQDADALIRDLHETEGKEAEEKESV